MSKREIKFRAWIEVGEKGQMFFPARMHYHAEATKYVSRAGFSAMDPVTSFVSYDVMQFTGLRDANGVEIYEGDIRRDAHCDPEIAAVVYRDDLAAFVAEDVSGWDVVRSECEVVGNIYENPELLEPAIVDSPLHTRGQQTRV